MVLPSDLMMSPSTMGSRPGVGSTVSKWAEKKMGGASGTVPFLKAIKLPTLPPTFSPASS